MPRRIAITGANGFLGRYGCADLAARKFSVRAVTRGAISLPNVDYRQVRDLTDAPLVRSAFADCDVVVHLAGLAHRRGGTASLDEFKRANVHTTRAVCTEAINAGVSTIVLMSSAAVGGLADDDTAQHVPRIDNAYARTKLDAERVARECVAASPARLLIFRPPMVYGPGMKGNPLRLFQWVSAGIPLPLAGVRNQRSMLFVGNLFAAIAATVTSDRRSAGALYVTDGPPVSTPDFIRGAAAALGKRPRLFHMPLASLRLAAAVADLIGHVVPGLPGIEDVERLTESFVVDDSHLRTTFSFQPPISLPAALETTAAWWRTRSQQQ
jgi:UDP-N-acetyl-alpha-D-quinovosamine dehydrogenase